MNSLFFTTPPISDGPSKESVLPASPKTSIPSGSSVTENPTPAGDCDLDCHDRTVCSLAGRVGHSDCGTRPCGCPKHHLCEHVLSTMKCGNCHSPYSAKINTTPCITPGRFSRYHAWTARATEEKTDEASKPTEDATENAIEGARVIAGFWRDEALRNKTAAEINQRTIEEQRREILKLRGEVAKLSASRNPALAQAILEWLDSDSDQLMVEDDGEKPVRLDMLLEAIDTEANPLLRNALYRRYAKFLALVLTSHRWPVTVQGETATPPVKVTNLMAGNR